MKESSKVREYRSAEFFKKFLSGKVIDIGAGNDPVVAHAETFDILDGDANKIDEYRPAEFYDSVYSSHCLEHMNHPRDALARWWKLVKHGGYLIVVVPDEELYEQGFWPSIFNTDHKASFRLQHEPLSPVSFEIRSLLQELPGAQILYLERQIKNFDMKLKFRGTADRPFLRQRLHGLAHVVRKIPISGKVISLCVLRLAAFMGCAIDQTQFGATIQIQAIIQKRLR